MEINLEKTKEVAKSNGDFFLFSDIIIKYLINSCLEKNGKQRSDAWY